ncbi:MAG: signal peptidase I [Chthoniobacteraceae bacterium]
MFFTPSYLKEGRELLHGARKMYAYKRDLLSPHDLETAEAAIAELEEALRKRDPQAVEEASERVNTFFGKRFPAPAHADWAENTEVFLVAIIIALGIRSFYLQPFTIPTGSMQPTLNGIRVFEMTEPVPNLAVRGLEWAWYGRSYFDIVPKVDDVVEGLEEVTRFWFFHYTRVVGAHGSFLIPAPATGLVGAFRLQPGARLQAGHPLRGYADTGDHVFVNKMAYNFRSPHRGEVFVFSTSGIMTDENRRNPGAPSQFYIKRLGGLPGDELRIDPPRLFVNGAEAQEYGFRRVMSGSPYSVGGYRGYANGPLFLTAPDAPYKVPDNRYIALGDNSYNSSDSRYWGTVPQENLMGCALFVYWPFSPHWGLIK